jgi:adenosylcobinamide kinase / adenosylcobinamide-phosphate guanylyltransferase
LAANYHITLVLGGARSGKSAYAEKLITVLPPPWLYCATGLAFDSEMRERIARHRARRGEGWRTIEEPGNVGLLLPCGPEPKLFDCLTLWLTNLILAEEDIEAQTEKLVSAARAAQAPIVFVSNEVGLGIVPGNALAREFRDKAGRLNQAVAAIANRVVFMAAGLPMVLKHE